MLQIQGIKGEAVVVYCEPLITMEMGYPRLLLRVRNSFHHSSTAPWPSAEQGCY